MKKCHICDNTKVGELETVKHSDGVLEAYYCRDGCGCRVSRPTTLAVDVAYWSCKCGISNNSVEFNWCYACGAQRH